MDFGSCYCPFSGAFVVGRILLKCDGFEHIPIWLRISYRWLIDPEYRSGNNIWGVDDFESRKPQAERWANELEEAAQLRVPAGCGHLMEWHLARCFGYLDANDEDVVD